MNVNSLSWSCYETVIYSIFNFDFKGLTYEQAKEGIRNKLYSWVLKGGGVLSLEKNDYSLKEFEHFLTLNSDGYLKVQDL